VAVVTDECDIDMCLISFICVLCPVVVVIEVTVNTVFANLFMYYPLLVDVPFLS
jgi:hypothetical protein